MQHALLLAFCLFSGTLAAQIGGDNVYEFLNLSPSARITAAGGALLTVRDNDVPLAFGNPGLLNSQMHRQLSFSQQLFAAGISNGYFGYGHHVRQWNTTLHAGLHYVNYGEFEARDERNTQTGTFKGNEVAFTVGGGYQLYERLSVGVNARVISSSLETYNSVGIAGDMGLVFHDTSRLFVATLVFKNAGTQLTQYREGNREPLPYEVQAALSKQLRYLPLRLSLVYRYLDRYNITYDDPNTVEIDPFTGSPVDDGPGAVDNFFRHLVFNAELLLGKRENFRLLVGYNHLRQRELSVTNYRSLAGLSFGFSLRVKQFEFGYGNGVDHFGATRNHFTLSTNLDRFTKGKTIRNF